MRSFLIIGGDKRQEYLKNILSKKFERVYHIAYPADICELGNIGQYSDIILPIPVSKDSLTVYSNNGLDIDLETLYGKIQPSQRVYGGGVKADFSLRVFDFMKNPAFKLINAYYTAQGTLRLLLENTDGYIVDKKALIIGFGDVAKTLADMLSKLGLKVFIALRNPDQRRLAKTSGYEVLSLCGIGNLIAIYDFIFGTVPANILTEEHITSMKNDAVYFELASAPFTAEKSIFVKYGKKYIFGGGLPGRYLPEASAELMADFILSDKEKGE